MTRTISRSATRQIAELQGRLTECRAYTLENGFHGQPIDPTRAWEALGWYRNARLTDKGDGTYTVSVHSNLWYELRAS
jgi:hypothetical protein